MTGIHKGAITNATSIDTGSIGHTRHRAKQNHSTERKKQVIDTQLTGKGILTYAISNPVPISYKTPIVWLIFKSW